MPTKENYITPKQLDKTLDHKFTYFRKELNKDMKTHMGVLFEKFSEEVTIVAEQYLETNRHLKSLENKMDVVVETIGESKVDTADLKSETDTIKHRLAILENKN